MNFIIDNIYKKQSAMNSTESRGVEKKILLMNLVRFHAISIYYYSHNNDTTVNVWFKRE